MFCHKCGTELPDESQFCSSCGKPVISVAIEKSKTMVTSPLVVTKNKAIILYLSFTVSAISIILFFFPWFKVIGQDVFAFLGYGDKDGFSIISFYWMIIKFMDYASFTLGDKVLIIIIALSIGAGAPLLGSFSHLLNCVYTLKTQKMVTKRIIAGPLWFIIGYYILKWLVKAYVLSATSNDWLGELVSILFGNLISMTSIPWILLALGIINNCLAFALGKNEPKESAIS